MYILGLLFILYCFIKLFFYGIYEIEEKKNTAGGMTICILAVFSLIFPSIVILRFFIL